MNAHDLFDAAFDTANDNAEATAAYVKQYADGLDLAISDEVAEQIAAAKIKFDTEGNGSNDYWHMIEKTLSQIEL